MIPAKISEMPASENATGNPASKPPMTAMTIKRQSNSLGIAYQAPVCPDRASAE